MSRSADEELLSVADAANRCSSSFQACFDALTLDPRASSRLEDQLSRFSLWASTLKVSVTGRASLDHSLRETPQVKDVVLGLLSLLDGQLRDYHSFLLHMFQVASNERHVRCDAFINKIADELSMLYRMMNIILRATKESQDFRALNSVKVMSEEEEEGLRSSFYYRVRDICHVEASEGLVSRLAETMVLRRKRILYRRMRHGNSKAIKPQENDRVSNFIVAQPPTVLQSLGNHGTLRQEVNIEPAEPESRSTVLTAPTLKLDAYNKASASSTISRPSTVGFDRHEALRFPCPPKKKVLRRFKRLEEEYRRQYTRIHGPDIPSSETLEATQRLNADLETLWCELNDGAPEIQCPYCFHALTRADIEYVSRWRAHVRDDLDPYVCLYEPCDTPLKLYSSSHEWLKHMQHHAQRWRCNNLSHGPLSFEIQQDYESHIKRDHRQSLNSQQIRILAERNRYHPEALFTVCPICGAQRSTIDLLIDHLIGHLRSLALQSLPIQYENEPQLTVHGQNSSQQSSDSIAGRSTIDDAEFSIIDDPFDKTPQLEVPFAGGITATGQQSPEPHGCGIDDCPVRFTRSLTNVEKRLHYEKYHSLNEKAMHNNPTSSEKRATSPPLACGFDDCTTTFTGTWKHGDRRAHIKRTHPDKGLEPGDSSQPQLSGRGNAPLPLTCGVEGCTLTFTGIYAKGNRARHIKTRHPFTVNDQNQDTQAEDSTLDCDFTGCTNTFTGPYARDNKSRHLLRAHGGMKQGLVCEEPGCGKTYGRIDARLYHYRKEHPHRLHPAVSRKMSMDEESA